MKQLFFSILLLVFPFFNSYSQYDNSLLFDSISTNAFIWNAVTCQPSNIIQLYAPKESAALDDSLTIHWSKIKNAGAYTVTFYDIVDEPLATIETANNQITVDIKSIRGEEAVVLYQIKVKDPAFKSLNSQIRLITFPSKEEMQTYKKGLESITNELQTKDATQQYIGIAAYYEKKNLFLHAVNTYAKAFEAGNNLPAIKKAYYEFLGRMNFGPKAKFNR